MLLVDNRKRDLNAASLIALHLARHGIECKLEPLEAFRAVVPAYRPSMVIINHVSGSHLVAWSKRLHAVGVLVGMLSNEGMFLNPEVLRYGSGRHYEDAHLDHIFCWNDRHRQGLLAEGAYKNAEFSVVGVPRFDFYFEPYSRHLYRPSTSSSRPHILATTNFGLARYQDLPPQAGDKFFAAWSKHVSGYDNYWELIAIQWRARQRFLQHMEALLETGKYDITVRPHPVEDPIFYEKWFLSLPSHKRERVLVDAESNITALILSCDLEISGESCTTAVELWIARKPTVELEFERHTMLYDEERSRGNIHCSDPAKLPALVDAQLKNPRQPELRAIRDAYLEKWCASPDGASCKRLADLVAAAVFKKRPADWSLLNANDFRRALKLHSLRKVGLAYHFDPLLTFKSSLFPKRYAVKNYAYEKSIKPHDVKEARHYLEKILALDIRNNSEAAERGRNASTFTMD